MAIQQINAEQAKDILDSDSDVIYIDVRTEPEFANGHVPDSVNIPVVWPDPATRRMQPNPDFAKVVSAHFPKDKRIILGCQAGGRSQFAAEVLNQEGFQNLSNMQGGFGGARDPMGRTVALGWLQLGYPVDMEVSEKNSYSSLSKK